MANPVGMTTSLPMPSAFLTPDGSMSQEWYQFFKQILKRTGGVAGPTDLAQQAFDLATQAHTEAIQAQAAATQALSVANSAAVVSNQAITLSTATASSGTAMQRAANLSDVTNQASARSNLHVEEVTLYFTIETATGQAIDMPITRQLIIPISLQKTQTYWQAAATDAVITVQVIRTDGTFVGLGSITLLAGNPFGHTFSFINQVPLNQGDVLRLLVPVSTGTGIGISIRTTIQ